MSLLSRLRHYTRSERGRKIRDYISKLPRPLKIIDLGGTVKFWEMVGITANDDIEITLVNNHAIDRTMRGYENGHAFIKDINRDATTLTPEELGGYGLIFSNSFFEHLDGWDAQLGMANTILASGRPFFMQTPNRFAPIDPHFPRPYIPFFALYPTELKARLINLSGLGTGFRSPTMELARRRMNYYHLLSPRQVRSLFPSAKVELERPFGVPMSILAWNS